MLLGLIVFVFMFGLVVLVHEFGHYVMARRSGIRVLEFGIGYPPRIKTLGVRDGVEYTLNAIPIGGFVRMLGEEDPSEPDSFAAKSALVRIRTLLAGPAMNLVLAAVLFASVLMLGEQVIVGQVLVDSVSPGSPAEQAGMLPGDVVVTIEGQPVRNLVELMQRIQAQAGQETAVSLLRDGTEMTVSLTPRVQPPEGEGAMGIVVRMKEGYELQTEREPFWRAIPLGVREVASVLVDMVSGFAHMFRFGVRSGDIAGPVGIVQIGGVIAQTGVTNLLRFTAFLSVNLFVINMLPLPALDGGRIAFILLEKLRGGKRVAPQQEGLVHFIGLLLILAFTAVVSYYDILRIFSGESLLP
jgi:regulator of sigma E protease